MSAAEFCLREKYPHGPSQDDSNNQPAKQIISLFEKLAAVVPHECGWIVPCGADWRCTFFTTKIELLNDLEALPSAVHEFKGKNLVVWRENQRAVRALELYDTISYHRKFLETYEGML